MLLFDFVEAQVQDNKSVFKSAYENAHQPHKDYKAAEQRQQKYIPGLNQPDASVHVVRPAEPVYIIILLQLIL